AHPPLGPWRLPSGIGGEPGPSSPTPGAWLFRPPQSTWPRMRSHTSAFSCSPLDNCTSSGTAWFRGTITERAPRPIACPARKPATWAKKSAGSLAGGGTVCSSRPNPPEKTRPNRNRETQYNGLVLTTQSLQEFYDAVHLRLNLARES